MTRPAYFKKTAARTKLLMALLAALLLSSCGYRIIGSSYLPFDSINIRPVRNLTYEPRLEDIMHDSLSREFINQGLAVKGAGADASIETVIRSFQLGAIAAINEKVKEQELFMTVDIRLFRDGEVVDFGSMASPIKITFQTAGSVTRSASEKDIATLKACREIAKEIVAKVILNYAK